MRQDYTHISVILDRTGSMEVIRDDTIGGFNALLREQQEQTGTATLTLVQFDTQDPYEVIHDYKLIDAVPELTRATYVPRAATPLLDAIGRGINDLEQQIAGMSEDRRPARVIMVIITDGKENSSREFRKDQIERMVIRKQEEDGWQMVFLSADLAAIDDALAGGFMQRSTMAFDKTRRGSAEAWKSVSGRISDIRSGASDIISFSEEDRKKQKSERERSPDGHRSS